MQRAAQLRHREAALLGIDDIHGPDNGGGAVNGHRSGDFIQRQAVEQDLHVRQRGDSDAAFAKFASSQVMVGVIAVERGHIESGREAGLALGKQVLETRIGILSRAKTREHAHRPRFGAVHRRLHAASIGIFARHPQVAAIVHGRVILTAYTNTRWERLMWSSSPRAQAYD